MFFISLLAFAKMFKFSILAISLRGSSIVGQDITKTQNLQIFLLRVGVYCEMTALFIHHVVFLCLVLGAICCGYSHSQYWRYASTASWPTGKSIYFFLSCNTSQIHQIIHGYHCQELLVCFHSHTDYTLVRFMNKTRRS